MRLQILIVAMLLVTSAGCNAVVAIEDAEHQVQRIVDNLDQRTTETGTYIRAKPGDINEKDPWGTPIRVTYEQGGVAEVVVVCSAGPDREFHTDDDISAQAMSANLKGIGEGIKKNAGETAAEIAKGAVKGTVQGVKESIKESLPKKRNKTAEGEPKT